MIPFPEFINDNGNIAPQLLHQILVDFENSINVFFLLISGFLVFLMQAGFAMLTAGSVRSKNTKNVLLKNLIDACVAALAYWLFGYAFAFGNSHSSAPGFIALGNFALSNSNQQPFTRFSFFFFHWAFSATAATIVSGSVAERTSFYAYMAYAFFLTAFVYPVVSHWVWGNGFLSRLFGENQGMLDFAGCSVVHMVGGFAGLAGAFIVGPRLGRFDSEGIPIPIPGHSATLASLGTFLLWFGWYGFNPGSALALTDGLYQTVQRCAVNTTLAAATGGVVTLIVIKLRDHIFDLLSCLNGILAGLVSITAACAFVHPYASVIIGFVGALVYIAASMVLLKLRIDDPLEAFPIHGATGFWGVIAVGLFSVKEFQDIAKVGNENWGAFYGGGGKLLAANLIGGIIIASWTTVCIAPLFYGMKYADVLRISRDEELIGNDISKHGGVAYPIDSTMAAERIVDDDVFWFGVDEKLDEPPSIVPI